MLKRMQTSGHKTFSLFLISCIRNWTPEEFTYMYIWQSTSLGITEMKIERMEMHFLSKIFATVAVLGSLSPY